jgi:hypothetical protein
VFIGGETGFGKVDGFCMRRFVDGGCLWGGFEGGADWAGADLENEFGVEEVEGFLEGVERW